MGPSAAILGGADVSWMRTLAAGSRRPLGLQRGFGDRASSDGNGGAASARVLAEEVAGVAASELDAPRPQLGSQIEQHVRRRRSAREETPSAPVVGDSGVRAETLHTRMARRSNGS